MVHSSAGAGVRPSPCSPASAGLPFPARSQLRPRHGCVPTAAPPTSLFVFSVSACFTVVLSTHLSLARGVCFCLFSAAGSVSRVSTFAFCHLFHQKQKLPESKDWKMATLSNVFHSRRPGPCGVSDVGWRVDHPGPVGCGGRAWLRTEATPSWIRPLPTVLPCARHLVN